MGQQANSGRGASLDNKKQRAAGRKQNDPAIQQITQREPAPPVPGAFGAGNAQRRLDGGNFITGETSEPEGGAAPGSKDSTEPVEERDSERK
jgi:hypothetical protein